jgi:hypothetical protein
MEASGMDNVHVGPLRPMDGEASSFWDPPDFCYRELHRI